MINIGFLGDSLQVIGEILIAYTVLAVHHRFRHEHKVDEEVFKTMEIERNWAYLGIALLAIGYGLSSYVQYF